MRRARPVFLLAILLVLAGVGATYYVRLKQQALSTPAKPAPLPAGTTGTSHGWTYTHTSNQKTVVTVHADDLREVEGKQYLTGVTIDILDKDGKEYNHVTSAKADADLNAGILYSEGEVQITMKVPADQPLPPSGKLMAIKSSGVRVEIKTGKAATDRLTTFQFDRGEGKAVGANYDPSTRQLELLSQVEMIWRGSNPKSTPMKIEAGHVNYDERASRVMLSPWSKLTRDAMTLSAGPAVVILSHGDIKQVQTEQAHGSDQRPGRNLEYAARYLTIDFNEDNQIQKIAGVENAKLVSTADATVTTITSDRVDMDFDTSGPDSLLTMARATGHGVIESRPVLKAGVEPSDTRILKSDVILTKMRQGGQELESVETQTPGAIEFVPNRPDQPHRWMNGDRIAMAYGPKNQLRSFRATAVTTRTIKPRQKDAKEPPPPETTSSKELVATFQANSSQIDTLEQTHDFRYEAGDRRARADSAVLDQPKNRIHLNGNARVWDSTGSTDAKTIVMDQKSGDFSADGGVNSTRLPDKDKGDNKSGGGMLSEDEPLHARARKMTSTDNNLEIHYEGNVVLWQGADRLEADVVEIDRDNSLLKANGNVVSQLLDKSKDEEKPAGKDNKKKPNQQKDRNPGATKQAAGVFTIVRAPELVYDDDKRVAEYKGGAILDRAGMKVKAQTIRAFLRNDSNDSSLDHAFADGQVEIHAASPGRVRNGHSEHAEYYVDEDKVILSEGRPKFIDSLRGTTEGEKLTWFSADDRLLVNGVEAKPAQSVLHRKVK